MIILLNTEEAFYKIQHPFVIKIHSKLVIEEKHLNSVKNIYKTPYICLTSVFHH